MARFRRMDVYNAMYSSKVIPLFYHADVTTAIKVVQALAAGGAKVIEFTNRGDSAGKVFSELAAYYEKAQPELILGIGSVLDAPTAGYYLLSGANFVVGSVLNAEVARVCNRHKVAYIPGCGTASEISQAEELGVEICKIFPADTLGGPRFIKSILGPTPWSSILPSGGVEPSLASMQEWFTAGAKVLGMGSNLVRKDWVEKGDFQSITQLTIDVLAWANEASKGGKK